MGLAWRKEFNRGGTMVGVARARDIANGANLSVDTVKRMRSFFARHEVDKKAEGFRPGEKGYPSNGRIAWALWGGDAGKAWATTKLETMHGGPMIFPEDEEFLAHYGAKGMKWGVRKDRGGTKKVKVYTDIIKKSEGPDAPIAKRKTKFDKKDVDWAKDSTYNSKRYSDIYNKTAKKVNTVDIPNLNKKYKGKDITPGTLNGNKYDKEFQDAFQKRAAESAKAAGPSPSGQFVYRTSPAKNGGFYLIPTPAKEVKHSAVVGPPKFEVVLNRDNNYFIVDVEVKEIDSIIKTKIKDI